MSNLLTCDKVFKNEAKIVEYSFEAIWSVLTERYDLF